MDPVLGAGRRAFLKWGTAVGAILSAALVGVPGLRAFLSPAFRGPTRERWVKLGEAGLFELGVPTKVDFVEMVQDAWIENRVLRNVWVHSEDGERFTVYSGRCPHLGCSYTFDRRPDPAYHPEGNVFHCACHHGIFALADGAVLRGPPPRGLDALEARVDDGILYARYQDFRVGIKERVAV